jgi:hypothetical protein
MKRYILDRAREASTWRGVTLLLTALGVPMMPGFTDALVSAGLGVAGLIGVLFADRK